MQQNYDTVEEFWEWQDVERALLNSGPKSLQKFREALGASIGVSSSKILLMPSGRQALEWILGHLPNERRGVLVSAFNCTVVEDAITKSGCNAVLYDFSSVPGVFDWSQVIERMGDQIGCLIVSHFFGVPTDFRWIIEECARRQIIVIEDCAHTLGAKIGGFFAGTLGDASILSFNYDKPISLGWGGAVVANDQHLFPFPDSALHDVPDPYEEMDVLKVFVSSLEKRRSSISLTPNILWRFLRAARLMGASTISAYSQNNIGAVQAELGVICLSLYGEIAKKRNSNAEIFASNVSLPTWPLGGDVDPCWLKQKVFVKDDRVRRSLCLDLQKRGYRVGNYNWPKILNGVNEGRCLNAMEIATRWVDVPIHQRIHKDELLEISETIESAIQ